MRTSFPKENGDPSENRKDFANKAAESESKPVRFPKAINHRGRTVAKIYGKSKSYSRFRLYYRVGGRSVMRHFSTYADALAETADFGPPPSETVRNRAVPGGDRP